MIRLCAERLRRPAACPGSPAREAFSLLGQGSSQGSQRPLEGHSWLFRTVSATQLAHTPRAAAKHRTPFAPTSIDRKENDPGGDCNRREAACPRVAFPRLGPDSVELLRPSRSILAELFSPLKLDEAAPPTACRSESKPPGKCAALLRSAQPGKPGAAQSQPRF